MYSIRISLFRMKLCARRYCLTIGVSMRLLCKRMRTAIVDAYVSHFSQKRLLNLVENC